MLELNPWEKTICIALNLCLLKATGLVRNWPKMDFPLLIAECRLRNGRKIGQGDPPTLTFYAKATEVKKLRRGPEPLRVQGNHGDAAET